MVTPLPKRRTIMSIRFSVTERGNPANPDAAKKWYANAHSAGEISLRELTHAIASRCTLTAPDVLAMLESLLELVPEELAKGNLVRLGEFGSFSVSLQSVGTDSEKDFTSGCITDCKIRFRPGGEVLKRMAMVKYEKVKKM
jgi:predicted histone-like DNA-binding protein